MHRETFRVVVMAIYLITLPVWIISARFRGNSDPVTQITFDLQDLKQLPRLR